MLPIAPIIRVKDGDPESRMLADRHYSRQSHGHALFVGPGRKIVLRNPEGSWVFAWRRCNYRHDGQHGWECTLFRNESQRLSSEIILDCEVYVAGRKFTYVKADAIRSINPGCCFIKAGWKRVGRSKVHGLVLLVKDAPPGCMEQCGLLETPAPAHPRPATM